MNAANTVADFTRTIGGPLANVYAEATPIGALVLVYASTEGRQIVEDLWPEVEWEQDTRIRALPYCTCVRFTKLPPHLAATDIGPDEAAPDALGFAVAWSIQALAEPRRVVHYLSADPEDPRAQIYNVPRTAENRKLARELFVEYVPSGSTTARSA